MVDGHNVGKTWCTYVGRNTLKVFGSPAERQHNLNNSAEKITIKISNEDNGKW